MDITPKERTILQKILTEASFDIMNRIASTLLMQWSKGPIARESEFETLKEAVGRDERKMALVTFLKTIEDLAHDK